MFGLVGTMSGQNYLHYNFHPIYEYESLHGVIKVNGVVVVDEIATYGNPVVSNNNIEIFDGDFIEYEVLPGGTAFFDCVELLCCAGQSYDFQSTYFYTSDYGTYIDPVYTSFYDSYTYTGDDIFINFMSAKYH